MGIKNLLLKDKILIFAILFSAIWHIFWLSAFKVIVVPKVAKSVRFSNVSFLGPILERGTISVSVSTPERTQLEQKYIATIEPRLMLAVERPAIDEYVLPGVDKSYFMNDEEFTDHAISMIDAGKIEPGRDVS